MALTHKQERGPDPLGHYDYGYDLGLLLGKTLVKVEGDVYSELLHMLGEDGTAYVLGNAQTRDDGYEWGLVQIEDIAGDLNDLVGSPITQAEEVSDLSKRGICGWTFYRLSTAKGQVVIRFCDNDYDTFYARWVDFMIFPPEAPGSSPAPSTPGNL
ncbi:hypothetical protein [Paracidovorax wautersii]|uniref:DUF7448 domain-containing protein n=1 Tax=Paracidovorax wautersii TaxID=1177982 RepID=A0ABU1IG00_9BURK|nr:hypothetical protein [Paracidovorax wautersii]MDR6216149.1 hypothetical protein [Paracidovorax wautersii]